MGCGTDATRATSRNAVRRGRAVARPRLDRPTSSRSLLVGPGLLDAGVERAQEPGRGPCPGSRSGASRPCRGRRPAACRSRRRRRPTRPRPGRLPSWRGRSDTTSRRRALTGEMIAPVLAHVVPESAVVMNWMNSLTPGFVVRAAISSPPISAAVSPLPPKVGKSNQSIVSPIFEGLVRLAGGDAADEAALVVQVGRRARAERLGDAVREGLRRGPR